MSATVAPAPTQLVSNRRTYTTGHTHNRMSTKVYPTPSQAPPNPLASAVAVLASMDASSDKSFLKLLDSNPAAKATHERLVRRLGYVQASKQQLAPSQPTYAQFTNLKETQETHQDRTTNDDDASADTSRVKVVVPPGAMAGEKIRVSFEGYDYEVAVPSGVVPGYQDLILSPSYPQPWQCNKNWCTIV